MLKHILLGFLNYRPMTGYELKSIMDESTMHFWHAYHSQIYTTLRKLEEEGLVISETEESDDKLKRRTYTITEAGRADLHQWLNSPLQEVVPVKEDLLVRMFFSGERDKQAVIDELQVQRLLHQQTLKVYHNLNEQVMRGILPEDWDRAKKHYVPFWTATLRFGIQYEFMYLNWIDDTLRILGDSGLE
jgi:DNA-binding PadR family transcriptional regulator